MSSPREEQPRPPVQPRIETSHARQDSEQRRLDDLEAQELQRALTLSAHDADEAKRREDEELARALQASLQVSSPVQLSSSPPSLLDENIGRGRPADNHSYAPSISPPSFTSVYTPFPSSPVPPSQKSPRQSHFDDDTSKYTGSPLSSFQQIQDDEEFARTLIVQDRMPGPGRTTSISSVSASSTHGSQPIPQPPRQPTLPQYEDIVDVATRPPLTPASKSAPATTHTSPNLSTLASSVPPPIPGPSSQAAYRPSTPPTLGRSTSAISVPTVPSSATREPEGRGGRSQSFGAFGRNTARPPMPESLGDPTRPPAHQTLPARTPPLPIVEEGDARPGPSSAQRPPLTVSPPSTNQYIDDELLRGVSE